MPLLSLLSGGFVSLSSPLKPQVSVANQDGGKHTKAVLAEIAGEIAGHGRKVRAHDQPEV